MYFKLIGYMQCQEKNLITHIQYNSGNHPNYKFLFLWSVSRHTDPSSQ